MTWICASCGLEHTPGEHDVPLCFWRRKQRLYEQSLPSAGKWIAEMPRTITTVINDFIRIMGRPERFSAEWKVELTEPDDPWERFVTVSISNWFRDDGGLFVSVHAFAYLKLESDTQGTLSYSAFHGTAPARRLTRKWVNHVLQREIETARLAALSATEADLTFDHGHPLTEEHINEYRQEKAYFDSTLKE